jgi:hypothetical protein
LAKRKDWTSTAITKGRLLGLKLDAEKNHRSYGGHLEYLLDNCGIDKLTDNQYLSAKNKLKKENKK